MRPFFIEYMMHFRIIIAIIVLCFFSACLGTLFFVSHMHIIDFSVLENDKHGKPSIVLDDDGSEWARFSYDKREPVDISKIPQHLIQAFIAAEDHAFFEHSGISYKGIIRSILINLYHCKIVQGASTITQQLTKLLFTDSRRTLFRKVKDQFMALLVEQQFTKEQILQLYLNHVCFGCGIYGVEAACQRFWSKSVQDISLIEAATLASIVKNPSNYCPLLYPLSAQKRRNIVLRSMRQMDFISEEAFQDYKNQSLTLNGMVGSSCAPHVKEMIRVFLEEKLGKKKLYGGGLTIQTTINRTMQIAAEKSFQEHVALLRTTQIPKVDGGLITLEGKTGQIKALVGGFDFNQSQYNRVTQAKRQMGSIFKVIVFAAAMQKGMNFAQTYVDEAIEMNCGGTVWQPRNHTRRFEGTMSLARALAHSNNIIAIKVLMNIGIDPVIALAKKFHISAELPPYPSLALGCVDCTLKEVVAVFNVFAQHGAYVEPHVIRWVKDEWGTKVFTAKPLKETVINSRESGQVAKVLAIGMDRARKRSKTHGWIDCDAIGKTGTNNDSRTCGFVGATPEYTTAVYLGIDDNSSLGKNAFAVTTAFPIWKNVNKALPSTKKHFAYDSTLQEKTIHARTGLPCNPNDPEALTIFV
jgi:penicillin-binding protein 1A